MGQHHHGQGRHEQGHDHGHRHGGHDHTDIDWAELAEHLEGQAELFAPLNRRAAAWVAARRPEPGLVVDVGSGPGVVSCLLAEEFPGARVVALDGSGPLLERARARAERLGLADRFDIVEAELPGGLDDLDYPVDLLWASRSLHHLGDQRAALAAFAERLAPGGMVALVEGGLPSRFLPRDIGIGRPGLQSRLDAAEDRWFSEMRAAVPGSVTETEDWPGLLTAVGLRDATSHTFLLDIPAPVPEAARAYAVAQFQRGRGMLADFLDASDLATVDRLLDPDDKASLYHRTDLFVLAAHTVHVARR
ncbi:class I SAM-dependent methyltransferase [Streptomyces europaeiscabiei]|uniref:class I SAM-dependent methyltransferase n=1 Tax=Streptomyces TaxID=1883 RepID=UPI000A37A062|nr:MULTISPECIES: class I SAM-dependent methyltransferase [Streptomyces]MDX3581754.1 class I SAM-dependent methyltransferase [Streptomyces europaeiscabiei]MDX3612653.1 class I SAM-dependent methyltransferase [Streptomyces europaeiscabiei]MDX3632363.1 class I SAM-dependent methyltransferase [Streptomyces europaeiscabiei]MDX3646646.1 class I SAM-dependent methyltransferase [Streptomyces europaeiscabiei]WUD36586.1 class I SAM-dependent methyltransferase [Streptomyces europaeiscabiei]